MGMVACFVSLPEEKLQSLRSDEDSIEEFLYPDDGDSEPENYLDVDKAWHGIHYLLTGEVDDGEPPLSLAIYGGEEFGPEVGYGSARFLTPSQVAEVSQALDVITSESLRAKFNPAEMAAKEIYPEAIWVRDGLDALDYLLHYYSQLVDFYRGASGRGDAVILWLA